MLYLMVGKSGSGKSTVVNEICKNSIYTEVLSYTTRPKRNDNDTSHTFVTSQEFDKIRDDLVAYTNYKGHEYGATLEQCKKADFYIIDPDGIEVFKEKADGLEFKVIYIDASPEERFKRMLERGDTLGKATGRLEYDGSKFKNLDMNDVKCYIVNNDLEETIKKVYDFIQ